MSKRKEEKREQEYYRKKIGEKLEEAYLSIPMGEPPSEETIKKWRQIADQKRAQRLKRKRILLSSAAAVVLCAGVCATCILHTPEAVAGNSGEVKIEESMESKDIYKSKSALPDWVKEEFVMIDNPPEGFKLEKYEISESNIMKSFSIFYTNINGEQVVINELDVSGDNNSTMILNRRTDAEKWGDIQVYINSYKDNDLLLKAYSFEYGDLVISVKAPEKINSKEIRTMVENTVWA